MKNGWLTDAIQDRARNPNFNPRRSRVGAIRESVGLAVFGRGVRNDIISRYGQDNITPWTAGRLRKGLEVMTAGLAAGDRFETGRGNVRPKKLQI